MQKGPWLLIPLIILNNCLGIQAQLPENTIRVTSFLNQRKVVVMIGEKPFTKFIYPDTLEKHTLYPIYSPDGQIITRGFPINPRPGDPADHPHHLGLWLNYEKVNGLDFWNNSYNIKADRKHLYGWIKVDSILETKTGKQGELKVSCSWQNQQKNILLREMTHFIFTAEKDRRIIDRITTLTAVTDTVFFTDVKDGLLGLRVTPELQIPSGKESSFKGDQATVRNTGNYLTSEGKEGDSAWGTRAGWCLLYGTKSHSVISIAMIDHPRNPGYPTYWHARGYGLFAANPLGQKIFSNGKESLNLTLQKNQSVTFRYRIVFASGKKRLSNAEMASLEKSFAESIF